MLEQFPGTRRARVLLPEGGDGPARHALRARAEGARLRARHAPPLPRDVRVLARGRAALRHDDRGLRGPVARRQAGVARRRALGAKPDLYLLDPQGRAARAARSATSTPGSPASAATSRRRAPTRRSSAGTSSTSSGRRTRSPTGTTSAAGTTSASATCRTTRCTTAATPRSAAPTDAAGRRPRGPLGRAPTRPSAASTGPSAESRALVEESA